MAGVRGARQSSGGGWKHLFWFAVAAAGVGFAGYVFLVPYQKMMSALNARSTELSEVRVATKDLTAERDQLKTDMARQRAAASDKAALEAKRKGLAEEVGTQLKTSLETLGATVVAAEGRVAISFPSDKVIDANGIDVSEQGQALLKIFIGTLKKTGGKVKIKARFSAAPPAKELRSLFRTAGELSAVRAARVMSALHDAGLASDRLTIVGEAERARPGARGKKSAAAVSDRLDIEIEPE